ncbi:MAG: hypothetical protein WCW53_15920 [Syntrophales bacterium]
MLIVKIMTERISTVAQNMDGHLQEACQKIFMAYSQELAIQPHSYIIAGVWGVSDEGELTDVQRGMHDLLQTAVDKILEALAMEDFSLGKKMGIEYLIRDSFIYRMFSMMELYKANVRKIKMFELHYRSVPKQTAMMGHA